MSTRENRPTGPSSDDEQPEPLPSIDLEDVDDVDVVGYSVDSSDDEVE